MRNFLVRVLVVCFVVCLALTFFTACSNNSNNDGNNNGSDNPSPHAHVFDKRDTISDYRKSDATCKSKAVYYFSCECGEKGTLTFEYGEKSDHVYEQGECKWCGNAEPSNPDEPSHTHVFDKQKTTNDYKKSDATCKNKAVYYLSCECGEKGTLTFEYGEKSDHVYENGECKWCSNAEPSYKREDDTIYFGSYPQSEITDETITQSLINIAGNPLTDTNGWINYNYFVEGAVTDCMYYKDVTLDTIKYRGVYIKSYRPTTTELESIPEYSRQDDYGYNVGSVYWFKFEPISWLVINEDGEYATLVCNLIIDSQQYDYDSDGYDNNYAQSTIRAWLNDNFYNTAFSELQKRIIKTTLVDNSAESTENSENPNACENTLDKVYLLSCVEMEEWFDFFDEAKRKQPTDYAKSQGTSIYTNQGGYYGNGYFWLRSPDATEDTVWTVYFIGATDVQKVYYITMGVVPVIQIKI